MPAKPPPHSDDTPQRLIAAGAEVFGRKGYRVATVREIVAKAKANVSAVNYHFGDKLGLYTAVLQHCVGSAVERFPPDLGLAAEATPAERLRAFVRSTLLRLFEDRACSWHGPLMAREFADPTPALDAVAASAIQPLAVHLAGVVRALAPRLDDQATRLCCLSIVGQCFFWGFGRPMLVRLPMVKSLPAVDVLTDHITRFSLAALADLAAKPKRRTAS
jgi:AcrR family transcriptional regulator